MASLKIDRDFLESNEILGVISAPGGDRALRIHLSAMLWCARYRKDHLPASLAMSGVVRATQKNIDVLEMNGVWVKRSDGGWELPHLLTVVSMSTDHRESSKVVYVIRNMNTGAVKIGKSRHPKSRLSQLQSSHSETLHLEATLPGITEKVAHDMLNQYRVRGEWFLIPDDVLAEFVKEWS